MSAPAPVPVHWTQAGLMAKTESEHGDECGPIAILDYLHLLTPQQWPLNSTGVDTIRAECINAGLMDTAQYVGMTVESIATALRSIYHVEPVKVVPWNTIDLAQFRADMRAIADQHWAVLWETANASALPRNQAGVQRHFLLSWGIDSLNSLGYLTSNGDTLDALAVPGGAVSPMWITWDQILPSQPRGYLVLPALPVAPPAPPVQDVPGAVALLRQALGKLGAGV